VFPYKNRREYDSTAPAHRGYLLVARQGDGPALVFAEQQVALNRDRAIWVCD
jgi:hypothetical protein